MMTSICISCIYSQSIFGGQAECNKPRQNWLKLHQHFPSVNKNVNLPAIVSGDVEIYCRIAMTDVSMVESVIRHFK